MPSSQRIHRDVEAAKLVALNPFPAKPRDPVRQPQQVEDTRMEILLINSYRFADAVLNLVGLDRKHRAGDDP
jgi:hypothetical protein